MVEVSWIKIFLSNILLSTPLRKYHLVFVCWPTSAFTHPLCWVSLRNLCPTSAHIHSLNTSVSLKMQSPLVWFLLLLPPHMDPFPLIGWHSTEVVCWVKAFPLSLLSFHPFILKVLLNPVQGSSSIACTINCDSQLGIYTGIVKCSHPISPHCTIPNIKNLAFVTESGSFVVLNTWSVHK